MVTFRYLLLGLAFILLYSANAQQSRARDLGIPFDGEPGPLNSITDVKGVEVGHSTIIWGEGENVVGKGPVRTGVTAIFPRGKKFSPVYANWDSLNGNGEMTGTTWITESGFLETPIMITNTNSVGVVRDAVLKWYVDTGWYGEDNWWYTYPVVAETYDGFLNDIYGFHVKEEHVLEAIGNASTGIVPEGNVGGGTGMMALGFKGGIGSASRQFFLQDSLYTLGVLVQANFGSKSNLHIAGVPVGMQLQDTLNYELKAPANLQRKEGDGSVIVVVATDAPLLPHQLKRLAQRVPLGLALVGGKGYNGSGDIFIAFSTANQNAFNRNDLAQVEVIPNEFIDVLFESTIQAVEESVINAMVAAETMTGINGNKAYAIPHESITKLMKEYKRYENPETRAYAPNYSGELIGSYQLQPEGQFKIRLLNKKLVAIFPWRSGFSNLMEVSRDVFEVEGEPFQLTFQRNENNKVERVIIGSNGQEFTAKKVK
ncbi:P1 family peptidase [Gramella sp. GC03-9]|uniref:P1 family peptidase n=1 Tax=Christiangramia oceanisediminis TaxID=2920386 RepID=A0A9X2KZI0_9FLAO|nr:P1 family peptidase [Gramella oceanisediminis]MCP9201243.1 P1 family peptidase [Gramella oceanisediminis]